MSDDDAFQVVERDHDGEYCSKQFWRDWYMGNDPLRARLVRGKVTKVEDLHVH
jgi:hypothetical protein